MATGVTGTLKDGSRSGGYAAGADYAAVFMVSSSGTEDTPRLYSNSDDVFTDLGYGPGLEYCAQHFAVARKPLVIVKVSATTVGRVSTVDETGVAGTSVTTLTGTPYDSHVGRFKVIAGGTIGTTGITFQYSLDDGKTWSPTLSLGTAATYAISGTGITLNFAAGTFVANDEATWYAYEPKWAAADLTSAATALRASSYDVRHVIVIGDFLTTAEADAMETALNLGKAQARYVSALGNVRRQHDPATMLGAPDLTFADATPADDTIVRSAGSWVADGFWAGGSIVITGSVSNNGTYEVATVTDLTLTLATGETLSAEGPKSGCTATMTETEAEWIAALRTTWDSWSGERIASLAGGDVRLYSPRSSTKPRRPVSWPNAVRAMSYGPATATARVKSGRLANASIVDDYGNLEEHDEAVTAGLEAGRFTAAKRWPGKPGVYIASPKSMSAPTSDFTDLQDIAVRDLIAQITHRALVDEIYDDVELNDDGTLTALAAAGVEDALQQEYEASVTSAEKKYASSVTATVSRTDNLLAAEPVLHVDVEYVPRGYLKTIAFTLAIAVPTAATA